MRVHVSVLLHAILFRCTCKLYIGVSVGSSGIKVSCFMPGAPNECIRSISFVVEKHMCKRRSTTHVTLKRLSAFGYEKKMYLREIVVRSEYYKINFSKSKNFDDMVFFVIRVRKVRTLQPILRP